MIIIVAAVILTVTLFARRNTISRSKTKTPGQGQTLG
jgi:hypothetical protein